MKVADYFECLAYQKVRCTLCPHHCLLTPDKRGICLTRKNINGALISENFCRPISSAIDPIEKKPLYHFYPGTRIFSTGPNGCNLKCGFCQNCQISQELHQTPEISPDALVKAIVSSKTIGVAYTYSEPTIWFETIMAIGHKVKTAGLLNVMVTNGYIEPRPLHDLLTVVDAMNIDIKSMNPRFYKRICKGELGSVLKTCEIAKKQCHIEVTNLLITDENDSLDEVGQLADYIATNLGADTPLHLSRYFPRHRFTKHATAEKLLHSAWETAREKLDYVYLGNIASDAGSDTCCPKCGITLITRNGYDIHLADEIVRADRVRKCGKCGTAILLRV
jgi:pyruvate formate lyase activating enzyme